MKFALPTLVLAIGFMTLPAHQRASAAVVDFEAPAYTAGNLIGQQGFVTNSYAAPTGADLTVSTVAPLSGAQSVLYNRLGATSGFNDMSKPGILPLIENGTSASDFTAKVTLQSNNNANTDGQLGVFFGDNAFNGFSPINVLLNAANSTNASGSIEVATGGGFTTVGTYTANNVITFTFNVDLDTQVYTLFAQDLTAGTPAVQLGNPAGIAFFGVGFGGPAAAGVTLNIGVGTFLRGGTGRIDNITLTAVPEPASLMLLAGGAGASLIRRRRSL